jgi:hypothetical protein
MSTSMGLYNDKDMDLLGLASSGGVLAYHKGACYMYRKSDDKPWSDFGGTKERGETTRETIWREAAEEAGITESDVTKVYGTIPGNGYVLLVVEVGVEPTTQRSAIETTSTVGRMERFPSGYERHVRLNLIWKKLGPMVREIEAAYEDPSHGFNFEDVGDDYNGHEEEKHGSCDPPRQYEDDAAEEEEDEGGAADEEEGDDAPPVKKSRVEKGTSGGGGGGGGGGGDGGDPAPDGTRKENFVTHLIEKIDKGRCEAVLGIKTKAEFETYFPRNSDDHGKMDFTFQNTIKYLKKMKKEGRGRWDKLGGAPSNMYIELDVKYKHSQNNPTTGRLFTCGGIQNLRSRVRMYLTEGILRDYDMCNAHPNLHVAGCERFGIECSELKKYCADRSGFLQRNDVDKHFMLELFNTDRPWFKIKKGSREIHSLVTEVLSSKHKMRPLLGDTYHTTNANNPISSIVNGAWCDWENQALQAAMKEIYNDRSGSYESLDIGPSPEMSVAFQERVSVMSFDGLMARGDVDLGMLEKATNLKWAEKPNVYVPPDGVSMLEWAVYDTGVDDVPPVLQKPPSKKGKKKGDKAPEDLLRKWHIDWKDDITQRLVAEKMIELFYKDTVMFTGEGTRPDGFMYNGVFWSPMGKHCLQLRQEGCIKIARYYNEEATAFLRGLQDSGKDLSIGDRDTLGKKLTQLDTISFTNGYMDWIKSRTYIERVEWNNNPNLCVFTDSVYDLEAGVFIEPSRDQFTNTTFGYAYGDGGDDDAVQEARVYIDETFLPSILGSEEIVRYVKVVMASFLAQGNKEEKGHFWLGDGRNGKGTLTKLLNAALGEYSGDLNLGFYTSEDTAADSPNNNLYSVRNARLLLTSEIGMSTKHPDQAQTFALEKFKAMTGGDPQLARQNHENNQVVFAGGSVLIQTNIMPEMMGVHRGENASLRQRIEIVRFPFSFVEDAALIAQEPEKYKLVDSSIKARFAKPEYRKAFIMMLLEYHKIYREEGIVTPASVGEFKRRYFEDADKVGTWIRATICEHKDVDYRERFSMGLGPLYATFKNGGNYVTVKQFKDDVANLLGTRDPNNKKGTRGVYSSSGYSFLQGYTLNDEMNDD